jgi:hypothetical protein
MASLGAQGIPVRFGMVPVRKAGLIEGRLVSGANSDTAVANQK